LRSRVGRRARLLSARRFGRYSGWRFPGNQNLECEVISAGLT
jgi:hypothetical protein